MGAFSSNCVKPAAEPWTLQELHHKFYGVHSIALYDERHLDVVPVPGDEEYSVRLTVHGTSVMLPESWSRDVPQDLTCTRCIVGLRIHGPHVQRAQLFVGKAAVDTLYGTQGVFNPTVLPLPPLHRVDVVVDEGKGPFEVSYTVRKLQNPRVDYRYWFTTQQRVTWLLQEKERTRRTLWFNHPISSLQVKTDADIKDVRLFINDRPYKGTFDKDGVCSFAPLTLNFSVVDMAALEITTQGAGGRADIIATDCQLAIVDKGMFMRKFG